MLSIGVGEEGNGSVVVRCGRVGCVVGTRRRGIKWFPAYWEEEDEDRVKDVTGGEYIYRKRRGRADLSGGNTYLGGFIAGLAASGGDPYEAALYGSVSASFTVEQIGLPMLTTTSTSGGEVPEAVEEDDSGDEPGEIPPSRPSTNINRSSPGGELRRGN